MNRNLLIVLMLALVALAACGDEGAPADAGSKGDDLLTVLDQEGGKADGTSSAKILDSVAPDAVITGKFDPRMRVYGYIVEARRGATLNISLTATAGKDAVGPEEGANLDTRLGIYGPFETLKKAGPALAESDDNGDVVAAPPITAKIEQDAKYLIAFSSWEDTGKGKYQLEVACEGTDLQCRRPEFEKPCKAGQLFIQGDSIDEDATWDTCDVVVLEPLTIAKDKTLTIRPGVNVRGNFLGNAPFGNVTMTVNGTLQAVGTPENPIAFTSFKEELGWGGLVLNGPSNSIENAFIERALNAVTVNSGATAIIADTVIEGVDINGSKSRAGVTAAADVEATFTRALVKGFSNGLLLQNAQKLIVEDSIIRENVIGVQINGLSPTTGCGNPPAVQRFRDPIFNHTDIINNTQDGILINGSDILVQVERCNIVNNGRFAVDVRGTQLAPESFIQFNNIHTNNNGGIQVRSFHRNGSLDISDNFWLHISDPELSASWQIQCSTNFTFSGFSPVAIEDAGPREEKLVDPVQKETFSANQN